MRAPATTFALLLAAFFAPVLSRALQPDPGTQPQPTAAPSFQLAPNQPAAIADVQFGWQGAIVSERWCPIRVWIVGGPRGFSGTLTAAFDQDATQPTRIIAPVAATPGLTTPADLTAALPVTCTRITFTLTSDTGREVDRVVYDQLPRARERDLDPVRLEDRGLILMLGSGSLNAVIDPITPNAGPDTSINIPGQGGFAQIQDIAPPPTLTGRELADRRWSDLRLARLERGSLPVTWAAYDSASLLVVRTEPAGDPDPRSLHAIHAWVAAGGRLVLIVDQPGKSWRKWLPDGPAGDLVELGEISRVQFPSALRRTIAVGKAEPADAGQARLVQLSPRAIADGWSLDWKAGDEASAGLLAEGPVGFGRVTIVGVEPQATVRTASKAALAVVWRDILARPLADLLALPFDQERFYGRFGGGASGPTTSSSRALSACLDSLASVSALGHGVFIAIAAGMLALALLVGPGDAVLLKRLNLRHRSWLTALGWIALLSLFAYALPPLARTGPSTANRLTFSDTIMPATGTDEPAVWRTGLTGVFASRAGPVDLGGFSSGSWWRGVSARYGHSGGQRTLSPFSTYIDAGGPGGLDLRGNLPVALAQGQWTYRTVMDEGPGEPLFSARIARRRDSDDTDEAWDVILIGVPEGVIVSDSSLRVGSSEFAIKWTGASRPAGNQPGAPRLWRGRTAHLLTKSKQPDPSALPGDEPGQRSDEEPLVMTANGITTPATAAPMPPLPPGGRIISHPILPTTGDSLPGGARRTPSIEARLDSGRWALIRIAASGVPLDLAAGPGLRSSHTAVFRILVPIAHAPSVDSAETPR